MKELWNEFLIIFLKINYILQFNQRNINKTILLENTDLNAIIL